MPVIFANIIVSVALTESLPGVRSVGFVHWIKQRFGSDWRRRAHECNVDKRPEKSH